MVQRSSDAGGSPLSAVYFRPNRGKNPSDVFGGFVGKVVGCELSVASCELPVVGCELSVDRFQVVANCLLVIFSRLHVGTLLEPWLCTTDLRSITRIDSRKTAHLVDEVSAFETFDCEKPMSPEKRQARIARESPPTAHHRRPPPTAHHRPPTTDNCPHPQATVLCNPEQPS
jgi:hypothetical protein